MTTTLELAPPQRYAWFLRADPTNPDLYRLCRLNAPFYWNEPDEVSTYSVALPFSVASSYLPKSQ